MTEGPTGRPLSLGAALLVAVVCTSVTAGLVLLTLDRGGPTDARIPGLRGGQLPGPLDGAPAPAFRLRDAQGRAIDTRALAGRPYAVTFLYTRCPDVCPAIGQELRQSLERLGGRAREVTVLGVSVDPSGDSPEAARHWIDRQRLPRNFRYLVGARRDLAPVWKAYFAAPQTPGRPETSTHTASIWLIDARGRLRTRYSAGVPVRPEDLAHDFRSLLGEAARSGPAQSRSRLPAPAAHRPDGKA